MLSKWFAKSQVVICKKNVVIPTLGAGILFNGERLKFLAQYSVQHLSVCLPLLMPPLWRNIVVIDCSRQGSDQYIAVRSGHLADLRR